MDIFWCNAVIQTEILIEYEKCLKLISQYHLIAFRFLFLKLHYCFYYIKHPNTYNINYKNLVG